MAHEEPCTPTHTGHFRAVEVTCEAVQHCMRHSGRVFAAGSVAETHSVCPTFEQTCAAPPFNSIKGKARNPAEGGKASKQAGVAACNAPPLGVDASMAQSSDVGNVPTPSYLPFGARNVDDIQLLHCFFNA